MFERVALEIAKPEGEEQNKWADIFYDLMADLRFLPNTPTLMNAGLDNGGTYSACFVLPISDNIDSIFDTVKDAAKIHKHGGGCIAKGSLVLTNKGPVPIENIQVGDKVWSYDEKNNNNKYCEVVQTHHKVVPSGKIGKIDFDFKTSVITTDYHPFMVLSDNGVVAKRADELCVKDIVIAGEQQPVLGFDNNCWLLGLIASDGAFDDTINGPRLRICKSYESVIKRAASILGSGYGLSSDKRYRSSVWETSKTGSYVDIRFRGHYYIDGQWKKAHTVKIPDYIWSASYSQKFSFVVGLIDGDSSFDKRKNDFEYSTVSEDLANGLLFLLSSIGITAGFRRRKSRRANERDIYEIKIKILPGVAEKISMYSCRHKNIIYRSANYAVPLPARFKDVVKKTGVNLRYPHMINGHRIVLSQWQNSGILSRGTALRLLNEIPVNDNTWETWKKYLGGAKIVEKITWGVDAELYDLTVRDSSTYLSSTAGYPVFIHNTGFSFSNLRPANSIVGSTRGTASGPISFMGVYNEATEVIKQGSRRRGANMGILRVDHPDILQFISCKADTTKLNNFNISVAITDKFMRALKENKNYKLIDPHTKETKEISAKLVWDAIIKQAHATGEPGLFFIDRANKRHPLPKLIIGSTNPCGELPLLDYESCNLGSINVSKYYEGGALQWKKLQTDVTHCIRFLDNVITQNNYPLPEIKKATENTRKLGLGIMGLADLFIKMGIPYDSPEALKLAKQLWGCIAAWGHAASEELSKTRGNFPLYNESIYPKAKKQMRNSCVTCIAPTGTISIIANCSSGIEPIFATAYERNVMGGNLLKEVHPELQKLAVDKTINIDEIIKVGVAKSKTLPDKYKKVFREAQQISYIDHIKMQAVFQKYSDSAVSKTINMSNSATLDDVAKAYQLAYDLGCVGITVYRDGCRPNQVLSTKQPEVTKQAKGLVRKRPQKVSGTTVKYPTHLGKLYVTVNKGDDGRPIEVIANIGKSGTDVNSMTEAIGRLSSFCLKFDLPPEGIVKQLVGLSGEEVTWDGGKKIISVPDAIGQALKEAIAVENQEQKLTTIVKKCVECGGSNVQYAENCLKCLDCNYSKCG